MTNSSDQTDVDVRYRTVARITLEITFEDVNTWADGCTLDQVFRDADRAARHAMSNVITVASKNLSIPRIKNYAVGRVDVNLIPEAK